MDISVAGGITLITLIIPIKKSLSSLTFALRITSLPDTVGGEGNPPVKRHHALLHEDTHKKSMLPLGATYSSFISRSLN